MRTNAEVFVLEGRKPKRRREVTRTGEETESRR